MELEIAAVLESVSAPQPVFIKEAYSLDDFTETSEDTANKSDDTQKTAYKKGHHCVPWVITGKCRYQHCCGFVHDESTKGLLKGAKPELIHNVAEDMSHEAKLKANARDPMKLFNENVYLKKCLDAQRQPGYNGHQPGYNGTQRQPGYDGARHQLGYNGHQPVYNGTQHQPGYNGHQPVYNGTQHQPGYNGNQPGYNGTQRQYGAQRRATSCTGSRYH
jgi:hypothetical protein